MGTQLLAEGERDRQAAALDRDARLDLGDQLRQDRHADAQPDDRRRDGDPGPAVHDRRAAATRPRARSRASPASRTSPLDQFLLPMALASDAVVRDGEMIGDPTEGALVVLAEKGGLDVDATRERLPPRRRAAVRRRLQADGDLPPDDRTRPATTSSAASSRARPTSCSPRRDVTLDADDLQPVAVDDAMRERYLAENERLGEQGLRVLATARKDFDPATFDPTPTCSRSSQELTLLALVGIVDPPRPTGEGRDRRGEGGRHPGPHDHRRPRRHRRGDRRASSASRAARSPAPSSRR